MPPYPICSRYLLWGRRAEIVVLVFISSVWISWYWYCPATESCPLSSRGTCDIFSKGSTKYALNSKRYFCRLSLGMRWCISSLFHQKPHVGLWCKEMCHLNILINSTQHSHKAVTNADMHYYIVWFEKSEFTLWLPEAGVDFLKVSVLSVISLWKSWSGVCFTGFFNH